MEIRGHHLSIPVLQGGMGVGVSLGRPGGRGGRLRRHGHHQHRGRGLSGAGLPHRPRRCQPAGPAPGDRQSEGAGPGAGMVAVNAMVATRQFADAVRTAVAAGVDAVVCGAGLPLELPALTQGRQPSPPIVSSPGQPGCSLRPGTESTRPPPTSWCWRGAGRGDTWALGEEALKEGTCPSLEDLLPGVLAETAPYAEKNTGTQSRSFPQAGSGAGRTWPGSPGWGRRGVQLATRFIATWECDASQGYKDVLLEAREEDLAIIHSPVGMPGRAVRTPLIRRLEAGERLEPQWCAQCMQGLPSFGDPLLHYPRADPGGEGQPGGGPVFQRGQRGPAGPDVLRPGADGGADKRMEGIGMKLAFLYAGAGHPAPGNGAGPVRDLSRLPAGAGQRPAGL